MNTQREENTVQFKKRETEPFNDDHQEDEDEGKKMVVVVMMRKSERHMHMLITRG